MGDRQIWHFLEIPNGCVRNRKSSAEQKYDKLPKNKERAGLLHFDEFIDSDGTETTVPAAEGVTEFDGELADIQTTKNFQINYFLIN